MAKVNRELVLNVANDLMALQKVVADLARRVGHEDTAPRRPPFCVGVVVKPPHRFTGRQARKDDALQISASDCAQYLLLLELLYDRSQAVTRLFIRWVYQLVTTSPEVPKALPAEPSPNSLGLGYLFEELSVQTKCLSDIILQVRADRCCLHTKKCRKAEEKNAEEFRCDRGSQANGALRHCESCRLMQELIKGIVMCLRVQLGDCCQVARTRAQVRAELGTLSQLGATQRLVDAVRRDVCTLLDCVAGATASASAAERRAAREAETRSSAQLLLEETEKLQQETERKASIAQTKVNELQNAMKEMEERLQAADERNESQERVRDQKEKELNAALMSIQQLAAQLSQQRAFAVERLARAKSTLVETELDKHRLEAEVEQVLERVKLVANTADLERKQNESLSAEIEQERAKNRENELRIAHLENELEKVRRNLKDSAESEGALKARLSECLITEEALRVRNEEETKLKQAECKDLRAKLKMMADHEALLVSYPDLHGPLERCEVGDPVVDMESQVEANELRVRLLNEQTARLRSTLEKVRRLTSGGGSHRKRAPSNELRAVGSQMRPPKTAPDPRQSLRDSSDEDDSDISMYRGKPRFHPHSWSD